MILSDHEQHQVVAEDPKFIDAVRVGFYAPAQLVRDARDHGVNVRPVDVTTSEWDCTVEPDPLERRALRLGFRLVRGLSKVGVERLLTARRAAPFSDAQDLTMLLAGNAVTPVEWWSVKWVNDRIVRKLREAALTASEVTSAKR